MLTQLEQPGRVKVCCCWVRSSQCSTPLFPDEPGFMQTGICQRSLLPASNLARSKKYRCCRNVTFSELPEHSALTVTSGGPACSMKVGMSLSTGFLDTRVCASQKSAAVALA